MFRLFELTEDLRPGRSANAKLLKWDGRRYVSAGESIVLHDQIGAQGARHNRGYCLFSGESQQWEVLGGLDERTPFLHPEGI